MKIRRLGNYLILVFVALAVVMGLPVKTLCQDRSGSNIPVGICIELTRDFYDALNESNGNRTRTYSNDVEQEYLRQTSVSSKFMVQTNIEILKRQEKIISLLESILRELQKQNQK